MIPRGVLPIAVDAMGGDQAPRVVVQGALAAAGAGVPVVLVGDASRIRPCLPPGTTLPIHHSPQSIAMHEPAVQSVRAKPNASVRRCVDWVAQGRASGLVSFGHSGAFVAACVLGLHRLEGVLRPALVVELPRPGQRPLLLLDVGANADCRPEHLVGFVRLGVAYAKVRGVAEPTVGLLANGEEKGKGNRLIRATLAQLARMHPQNLIGTIEPDVALGGGCDVLVCDGFTGNIMLKTAEGVLALARAWLGDATGDRADPDPQQAGRRSSARDLPQAMAWESTGGALLLGVHGLAVLGHGRADARAIAAGICTAHAAARTGVVTKMTTALASSHTP